MRSGHRRIVSSCVGRGGESLFRPVRHTPCTLFCLLSVGGPGKSFRDFFISGTRRGPRDCDLRDSPRNEGCCRTSAASMPFRGSCSDLSPQSVMVEEGNYFPRLNCGVDLRPSHLAMSDASRTAHVGGGGDYWPRAASSRLRSVAGLDVSSRARSSSMEISLRSSGPAQVMTSLSRFSKSSSW